jgi:YidC/Oxa1 family membrane protein insertase
MKKITLILSLLLILASFCTGAFATRNQDLLAEAKGYEKQALEAKMSADKLDYYDSAVKKYQEIAKSSDIADAPYTVQALYKIAEIRSDIPGRLENFEEAKSSLTTILNSYDKPKKELEINLQPSEAELVLKYVEMAKVKKEEVLKKQDKVNSSKWQYKTLDFFVSLTGRNPNYSYWLAIIMITILVKLVMAPLTKAQFKSMKEMQKITPLIKEVQTKYKGDQKAIGEKTMELYKEHQINPFASCWPLLIQLPILFGLFYTIRAYEYQFAQGKFLWIGSSLSHTHQFAIPFMKGQVVWFTAKSLAEPDLLLVLLYLVSMFISTKLSSVDPSQAQQQKMMAIMMPLMFGFIFAGYPSAFLLYWLVFNIIQTAQQYLILRPTKEESAALIAATENTKK